MTQEVYCRKGSVDYFDRKTGMSTDEAMAELEKVIQSYGGHRYSQVDDSHTLEADYTIPGSGIVTALFINDQYRRFRRQRFKTQTGTADTAIFQVKRNDELTVRIREALGAHKDRHIIFE